MFLEKGSRSFGILMSAFLFVIEKPLHFNPHFSLNFLFYW